MSSVMPKKIKLEFKSNGELVSNLLVYCLLISKSKNNFTIGPLTTDKDGMIQISQEKLKNEIEFAKKTYPMDYSGSLTECTGIEAIVESKDQLSDRIDRLREFYPDEANGLEKLSSNCTNAKFLGIRVMHELPMSQNKISVELKKV